MKLRLPKGMIIAASSAAWVGVTNAASWMDSIDERINVEAGQTQALAGDTVKPNPQNPHAIAKDGAGTLTVSGGATVAKYANLYVREGEMVISDGASLKLYPAATPGSAVDGYQRYTSLGVAGKDAVMTFDNGTYISGTESAHFVGGIDGNGIMNITNNSTVDLGSGNLFVIGDISVEEATTADGEVDMWSNATTAEVGAAPTAANRYVGSYVTREVNGSTYTFGKGVVNVNGGSYFKATYGNFWMSEGALNVSDAGTRVQIAQDGYGYRFWMCLGNGSTSEVNVLNGATMDVYAYQFYTNYGDYSTGNITVDGGSVLTIYNQLYGGNEGSFVVGYHAMNGEGNVYVTNGSTMNVGSYNAVLAWDDNSGDSTAYIYVDGTSKMTMNHVRAYTGTTVENAGEISVSSLKHLGGSITNGGKLQVAGDISVEGGAITNSGVFSGNNLTLTSGSVTNAGTIEMNGSLTMAGGTLELSVSNANLTQADVTVGAFDGQSGTVVLRATENLKAGTYHIISVRDEEEETVGGESDAPEAVTASEGGVQYTLIGADGLETTWEGGDLFLTLNEQLIVSRDPLSDALMAANWGVFHSSQAFTGTLWAPRAAASCTQVDSDKVAWATAYSSFISQNDADKFKGADYSIYGASMGVETPLGKNRIIGVAFGYDMGKASLPNTSDIDQTSCHIAAYGRAAVWCFGEQGNLALDWSAAYGSTTSEHDAVPGDWTQDSFQLDARATYSRSLSSRTSVSAFFGAQYYSQESASTARAQADSIKNFRLMLGTGIQRSVTDKTTVFGEAMLRQDVMRDNPNVMVDGFHYGTGANPGRFGGSISAGVEHQLNDDWKVRANYSFEVADDQNVHSFGAGASYSF